MLFQIILTLLAFLGFLFALGYTGFWGGPYGLAQFFFWFLLIAYAIIGYIFFFLYKKIKEFMKKQTKHHTKIKKEEVYREVEIIEEETL